MSLNEVKRDGRSIIKILNCLSPASDMFDVPFIVFFDICEAPPTIARVEKAIGSIKNARSSGEIWRSGGSGLKEDLARLI